MRNTRWLRYGLASIIVVGTGLGGLLAACGDDDTNGGSSGTTPEAGGNETGGGDSGSDTGTDTGTDAGTFAKLTLINATTDMGPNAMLGGNAAIRVCFRQGTNANALDVAPYPPLPDRPNAARPNAPPGIYYGTGGTFPSFGLDLSTRFIQPIVMNAKSLFAKGIVNPGNGSPGTVCDEVVGNKADAALGFQAGVDYWELPPIPAGTFLKEKAYVLALTGCVGDATEPTKPKCGPGYEAVNGTPGVGNLKVQVFETTRAPVSASALGVQFLHASAPAAAVFGAVGVNAVQPGFVKNPADGGGFTAVTDGGVMVHQLTPAVGYAGKADTDFFALGEQNPLSPPQALLPFSLPQIQAFSGLGAPTAPTVYANGQNYVFIAVGDPDQTATPPFAFPDGGAGDGGDGSQFNTKFFHFLAFPTDPTVAQYKP